MRHPGWLFMAVAVAMVTGCQAPAPPTPTVIPPTLAPPAPTPTAPAVTSSRVQTLNAAEAAFRSGDLKTAAELYDRVSNTPPGSTEGAVSVTLTDFAHFRAMVALLADGREDDARTHLEALQTRDANAPLARLGNQLWDQYGMTGQLRGACAQLQPQIASQAGPVLTMLQGIGVTIDAQTLCSVPQP